MTSFDSAEFTARKIHERRTREALRANEIAKDSRNQAIQNLEQRIKEGIQDFLGNKEGERNVRLSPGEARLLFSHALGTTNDTHLTGGVEVVVSQESPESRIVINPLLDTEKKHMQMLSVNGPLTASDFTLLAREDIKGSSVGNPIDLLGQQLTVMRQWDRVVSWLQKTHPTMPQVYGIKQPAAAA